MQIIFHQNKKMDKELNKSNIHFYNTNNLV